MEAATECNDRPGNSLLSRQHMLPVSTKLLAVSLHNLVIAGKTKNSYQRRRPIKESKQQKKGYQEFKYSKRTLTAEDESKLRSEKAMYVDFTTLQLPTKRK